MDDTPEQGEKTEEATPKRREEAREKGQVAFSTEIVAAAMLMAIALAFVLGGGGVARAAGELVVAGMAQVASLGTGELSLVLIVLRWILGIASAECHLTAGL